MENKNQSKATSLITYIHEISGQLRKQNIIESEHAYAKFWNRHPDPSNKSRPARFLFMQSLAKWTAADKDSDIIDIDTLDNKSFLSSNLTTNPLVAEVTALTKGQVTITEEFAVTDSAPNKSTWSTLAQRIWAKALNILYTDRLIRLSVEGTPNEIIAKKMISSKCASKFRHLFASLAFWDPSILSWLHSTLLEHVSGQYLIAYHESMQILRTKLPVLIDRFYLPPAQNDPIRSRNKGPPPDPIQNVLNNHKPKRIKNCPLFILVPNGPQPPNSIIPQRLKHWQLLFASLGKIITISINYRPAMRVKSCLNEIMTGVREKITECRTTFTEGRPIILVGFGHSSLIATHVALDPAYKVTATVCLGFPLAGVNGFRGDLDDPLLDTTVPTLFVIGQNATLSSIDDVEDFRERITKTETGLVVVGGANDHLIVSQTKQRFTGITQAIVDRCISDEIYDFINFVMNPHFVPSENNYISAAGKNLSKSLSKSLNNGGKTPKSKSKSKTEIKPPISDSGVNNKNDVILSRVSPLNPDINEVSVSNKESEMLTQSTCPVSTDAITNISTSVTLTASPMADTCTNTSLTLINPNVKSIGTEGETPKPKPKPKPKKSKPKPKKADETKKPDELKIGKDVKEDKECKTLNKDVKVGKETKEIEENKEGKDIKETIETKVGKSTKDSKETKSSKDVRSIKDTKEDKKKDKELNSPVKVTPESVPMLTQPSPQPLPPLLTAPIFTEPSTSTSPSSLVSTMVTTSTSSVLSTSAPPPLTPVQSVTGAGVLTGTKRKKIPSVKSSDSDSSASQPKKKREEVSMSISSLEKIERTLDEVIATSVLEFSPTLPSPTIEISGSPTVPPQAEKIPSIQQATSTSLITTPTTSVTTNSTPTPKSSTNIQRNYDFSYGVSEIVTLPPSSSATRTRQIRAPKQLDI